MKNKKRIFLRSFALSLVVVFCILIGCYGFCEAYKNIRLIAFGEYRNAVEINEKEIKIFDFVLEY